MEGRADGRELVPLEQVAERLGIPRQTMRKRVMQWKLRTYLNPLDRRQRLLDWAEVEAAARPRQEADHSAPNTDPGLTAE